jgi:hypothetical protein
MKKQILLLSSICILFLGTIANAQKVKSTEVPTVVKSALQSQFPSASKVTWEKEKGNFEANWGGKSGEDHSVVFTPAGGLVETLDAIPVSKLPKPVFEYVKKNYKGAKISEAGKGKDANGVTFYEAEVNHKDLVFDENGNFQKID